MKFILFVNEFSIDNENKFNKRVLGGLSLHRTHYLGQFSTKEEVFDRLYVDLMIELERLSKITPRRIFTLKSKILGGKPDPIISLGNIQNIIKNIILLENESK